MKIQDWLGHLRTDRRGIPVPYLNRWGPERPDQLSIRVDPVVHQLAVFQDDADEPDPDFTAQNMQRQRECMMRGLCQVCARPVPWRRRLLVVSSMSTSVVDVQGVGPAVVVTEPWLDQRCAGFALNHCPALIRRKHGDDLTLLVVDTRPKLIVSNGWVEGPLEAESRRIKPAMWVKAIIVVEGS